MAANKSQHFVPQHYLRQFRIDNTKQIFVCRISPYYFAGPGAIRNQCKADYFYRNDGNLDELLTQSEQDLAPTLIRVSKEMQFSDKELVALCLFAVIMHIRTRKSIERTKVLPKYVADKVIKSAIDRGDLREPAGGWKPGMIDFGGVGEMLMKSVAISSFMEMQTLKCKLLQSPPNKHFITSDHPVVLFNQYFSNLTSNRSFAGFSRSGFQLFLPISPTACAFFYDPKVYKVGRRNKRIVLINHKDIELVNSLQIQSAESCVYFTNLETEMHIRELAAKYGRLREPVEKLMTVLPGRSEGEQVLHIRTTKAKLQNFWSFCRLLKRPIIGEDNRRSPAWTGLIEELMLDIAKNPNRGDIFDRMETILNCNIRTPP